MQAWEMALQREIDGWVGTPHAHGQDRRGVATDCIGFVGGVLDALHGFTDPPRIERHATDVAWHDWRAAARTSAVIAGRWPHVVIRQGEIGPLQVEGGDVTIVRAGLTAGHVGIVGADPRKVWHCSTEAGVCFTGIGAMWPRVIRIWRPTGKRNWR